MTGKQVDARPGPAQFVDFGKERTEAMLGLQKELLEAYEQPTAPGLPA